MMTTSSFRKLYADRIPYLEELILNTAEEWNELYSTVTKVGSSATIKTTDQMIAPYGLFDPKPEGTDLTMDDLVESYTKDFVQATWAKGIALTKESLKFAQDAVMNDRAVGLAMSQRLTVEQIVFNECYSNGFTTTNSADGTTIYGTHTLTRGGTVSNVASADLDQGSLEDAMAHFSDLLDEAGKKVMLRPAKLIVGTALEAQAMRLLNSMYLPGTDRNDVNDYITSRNVQLVVSPYLSSSTMWFLIADPRLIKAKVYWGWRPELETDVDFLSKNGLTSMDFSLSTGVSDWRGLYGSTGS